MARDWRSVVLAALAAAMLAGACVLGSALGGALGAFAQAAEEDEDEGKAKTKAKKQDPADAQRAIDAALKHLQAGKTAEAVQAATATMTGGNLPPAIMAKALYVRGVAYRRQGRSALAISDLTGALWLKGGLGGDEREDAIKEKAAAYADAGLADPGESRQAPKSAGGGGNWLSGIFGGLGGAPAPPSPPPRKVEKVERAEPPPPAPRSGAKGVVGTSWTSETETPEPPPKAPPSRAKSPAPTAPEATPKTAPKTTPKTAKAPRSPTAKKVEGRFLVQLAAMRTQAEALALAAKAKREHGTLLAARSQSIDRQVFGNMGAFYRVRFGPFASAQETQTVCARLQGSGIDCLPVVNQ
jgi:cell division septation protein DedD